MSSPALLNALRLARACGWCLLGLTGQTAVELHVPAASCGFCDDRSGPFRHSSLASPPQAATSAPFSLLSLSVFSFIPFCDGLELTVPLAL